MHAVEIRSRIVASLPQVVQLQYRCYVLYMYIYTYISDIMTITRTISHMIQVGSPYNPRPMCRLTLWFPGWQKPLLPIQVSLGLLRVRDWKSLSDANLNLQRYGFSWVVDIHLLWAFVSGQKCSPLNKKGPTCFSSSETNAIMLELLG